MYENAAKMTPEQVEEYSQNLFFNYYILNQTLRAFGLKKKIVGKTAVGRDSMDNIIHYEIGESANEFVGVLIDEAIGGKFDLEHESGKVKKTVVKRGTLMDRLYVKVGDDYLDVHHPAQNENELSADEMIEQMVELFGFDEDIWFGKKRMNLGITLPDAIKDDKARLSWVLEQFEGWCEKRQAAYRNDESYDVMWSDWISTNNMTSEYFVHKTEALKNPYERMVYDPLDVNEIYAFIYSIVSENVLAQYPGFIKKEESYSLYNFEALLSKLDYFIEDYPKLQKPVKKIVDDVKDKKGVNKGKGTLLMEELKEKIPEEEYDEFIGDLCSEAKDLLIRTAVKSYIETKDYDTQTLIAYRPKTNAYSLSTLIYFIVYNMGCYCEEDDFVTTSAWRFLNRYVPNDPEEKDTEDEDNITLEPTEAVLAKMLPAPLQLKPESDLLALARKIESFDLVFTLNDENKESISMKDSQKAATPQFSLKNINGLIEDVEDFGNSKKYGKIPAAK